MLRRLSLPILAAIVACGGFGAANCAATVFDYCYPPACTCGNYFPGCACCDAGYMKPIRRAQCYNWNRNYAHTEYGLPVALVVPPTAQLQTNWGWGVASSRISRIDHQFQRNFPGGGVTFGGPFRPTPVWPSDTTQFGVYPVRGPW
jgi:hypothetical protein